MLKRTLVLFILAVFMFQALVFNTVLYSFTLLAKLEDKTENAKWLEFSEKEYSQLKLNDTEFSYQNNLYDVLETKVQNGKVKLFCSVDAKEKDFLERLIEGFRQSKTKKFIAFAFVGDTIKVIDFLIRINNADAIKHLCFSSSIQEKSLERTIPPPKV